MANQRPHLHKMTLTRLRNELIGAKAVAKNCPCRACLKYVERVEEVLAARELEEPAPKKLDARYDPLLLEMGIKKKRMRPLSPAQRIAAGKRLTKLMAFSNTVGGKAREQDKLDRLRWARGQTVRG